MSYALRITFVLGAFSIILGNGKFVFAQNSAGIEVTPPLIEENADPGSDFAETIEVINVGESEITLYPKVLGVKGATSKGQPIFDTETKEVFDLPAWIQFENNEIILQRGQRGVFRFHVHVPEDASPGGHFAGIILSREAGRIETTGAGVGFGVGNIVHVRVSGEIREEAEVLEFQTDKAIYETPAIKFIALVKNKGNVLIRPIGVISIEKNGEEKATIQINEGGGGVFPGGERIFEMEWKGSGISWGKYEAIISLVYGEEGRKTISQATTFWVLPIKLLGGVVGGGALLMGGIFFGIRWYVKKRIHELQNIAHRLRGTHRGKQIERRIARSPHQSFIKELVKTTALTLVISSVIFILLLLFV